MRLVMGKGFALVEAGTGIGEGSGLMGAAILTRFFGSMLFDVAPTNPVSFAVTAGVLTGVALQACYIPGRRATRVDPLVALRDE